MTVIDTFLFGLSFVLCMVAGYMLSYFTGSGRNLDALADIVAAQAARIAYLEGTIAYLEGIIDCEDEDEDVTAEDLGI